MSMRKMPKFMGVKKKNGSLCNVAIWWTDVITAAERVSVFSRLFAAPSTWRT